MRGCVVGDEVTEVYVGEGIDGENLETPQATIRTLDFIMSQLRNPSVGVSKRVT